MVWIMKNLNKLSNRARGVALGRKNEMFETGS
jgi:hypothetical protein